MTAWQKAGVQLLGGLAGILSFFYATFCTDLLWRWFATPVFGMAPPSLLATSGLLLLLSMCTFHMTSGRIKDATAEVLQEAKLDESWERFIRAVFVAGIASVILLDAFVLHWFLP